ncbi:MAG: LpxI family protein [Xanthobacteraceae bacterium]
MSIPNDGRRPDEAGTASPVAVICGGGVMPFAVADALARRGRAPILFAIRGFADSEQVARYSHHWVALGESGRLQRLLREINCRDIAFVGQLVRPRLREIRLDWSTICLLPRLAASLRGGDDHLLSAIARMFEDQGYRIVGVSELAPELLVPRGTLGQVGVSERDRGDIVRALALLSATSPFDVGQAAVVANNHVLAIEGVEGTDLLLERIADMRQRGRLRTPPRVGVIVKAPKREQDTRFDLPSIGPTTVEGVARAGLAGIAVVAGASLVVEAERMIALADEAKLFVAGIGADGAID